MVKEHLNPGGVVTQWVPLYETDEHTVKSEIATFFAVFPGGTVWANAIEGAGYDLFLLGQNGPTKIDVDQIQARLDNPAYARVANSLRDVGFASAVDLLSIYSGQESDLQTWLRMPTINLDSNLRLQYMAGLALNNSREDSIYKTILSYRTFPSNIITGSPQRLDELMRLMQAGGPQ